jgi:type IV pilus assembly protein PilA
MNKKGFTLIELLIVVAIIGIIAAIAIPNLLVALQKGKQKATMGDMKSIGTAIESYIVDWSFCPSPGSAVGTSIVTAMDLGWFRPFYIKVLPLRDGWGAAFRYTCGTIGSGFQDAYSLTSYGKNNIVSGPASGDYEVLTLADFNNDIMYSNGQFTLGPRIKR